MYRSGSIDEKVFLVVVLPERKDFVFVLMVNPKVTVGVVLQFHPALSFKFLLQLLLVLK